MTSKTYTVWTEDEQGNETAELFRGSKSEAYRYYNQHGGAKAGLHIGYDI